MTLIFRLIIRRDIWILHSKVFSSGDLIFTIRRRHLLIRDIFIVSSFQIRMEINQAWLN